MPNFQRYHVASGTYFIAKSSPLILKASMGTCVGLSLYDQKNGVGGLIHLLLDKPPSLSDSFNPEKYAQTGLPLFWDALLSAGASPDNLIAWVAGGALVGPVQEYDLAFDIGGKTTESIMAFLASKRIDNIHSETGGFFTCSLSLNMRTWDCSIDPAGVENVNVKNHPRISSPEDIICSMAKLQPIPQVALKILRLINEDNYDITILTEEIRKDQILSALTIKLCNSAYVSSLKKIESMDHALVFLGQKKLIKFVISAAIKSFFKQAGMGYSLCKGGIYHHAVGTAIIAEEIARITKKAEPALAYTGGLLHDIGKVVLDQHIQADLPLFYRQLYGNEKNSSEIEKAIFGLNHQEAGTTLAMQWSFPASLIEVIKHHHQPENAPQYKNLVHIIYLADLLMSRFNTGLEAERIETDTLAERLEILGFSIGAFSDIVNTIPAKALEYSSKDTLRDE
jgi:putative nucleotidyltransferase with HDIG domain